MRLSNGTVLAFGQGMYGVLGLGNTNTSLTPVVIPGLANVVSIATGERHSAAVLANGTLLTWGDNSVEQLGFSGPSALSPTPVPNLSGIVAVACGKLATLCIDSAGVVRQWGATGNYLGSQPQVMPLPMTVTAIASAGDAASQLAFSISGSVYTWGSDCLWQTLGGGTAACSPGNTLIQPAGLASGVIAIEYSYIHGMALSQTGTVRSWGTNINQLGYYWAGALTVPTPTLIPNLGFIPFALHLVPTGAYTELRYFHGEPGSIYANLCTAAVQSPVPSGLISIGGLWLGFADMLAWSAFIQAGYPMATGSINATGTAVTTLPMPNSALAGVTITAVSFNLLAGNVSNISPIATHTF